MNLECIPWITAKFSKKNRQIFYTAYWFCTSNTPSYWKRIVTTTQWVSRLSWLMRIFETHCALCQFPFVDFRIISVKVKYLWLPGWCHDMETLSTFMQTSSNGNIYRVSVPFCGEFTDHPWIPLTKASNAELWCFLWSAPEQTVE